MNFKETFNCSDCYQAFYNEWNLNRHYNEKHAEYRFVRTCPDKGCNKSFNRKYYLEKHLRGYHSYPINVAKAKANEVEAPCISAEDKRKERWNPIDLCDYSDISDDELDFSDTNAQKVYFNVPSFNIGSIIQNSKTELDEELLPEDPYTTFSPILYSDVSDNEILIDEEENLDNLDKTFCDISNEFQLAEDGANKSEDEEDNIGDDIISITDTSTSGDMNSSSHDIVDETTTTIIIALTRRDFSYTNGVTDTVRESRIQYSNGLNPEEIDFSALAANIVSEVNEHSKNQNKRFTSADNL
ncbi:unnamed protein product [Mytilus coruscus]|uniref:C2H2-type domain-containing protein n=1 Tax=Mytilus coruscus TaxID=42192 RepID=A0A6J7ZXI1_MYTCO|nr:unnamed protein product [Mytilus coruscus]